MKDNITIKKEGAIMKIETSVKLHNMKIDNIPLVLIKSLFCVVKEETDIKGYWKDKEGKLYIDNIVIKEYGAINEGAFQNMKSLLFASGEEAVFYKDASNYAIIEGKQGSKDILKKRIAWIENIAPSKEYIEVLLEQENGLTIYKLEEAVYLLEVYKQ